MSAATEESAVQQALDIVGATRDEVSIEVVERTDKKVTVRISPRRDDAPPEAAPVNIEPAEVEAVAEDDPSYADDAAEDEIDEPFAPDDAPSLEQVMEDEAELEPILAQADDASTFEADEAAIVTSAVPDEAQERARSGAQEMLERMGLDAQATLSPRPFTAMEAGDPDATERVYVSITGADVGILIGKHGATLQSFQYLLNLSLNNRLEGEAEAEPLRVVVDAGGYRARRMEVLERMAQDTADRALRERRSIRMEAMPAHERRLVHMALQNDRSVSTGSEGREPQRFVVVAPAGMERDSGRPSAREAGYDSGFSGRGGRGGGGRRGRR